MPDRPTVILSTPRGDVRCRLCLSGDAPEVLLDFERLVVSRMPYKGSARLAVAPDGEISVAHSHSWRADKFMVDPTYDQRRRVESALVELLSARRAEVLAPALMRATRQAELQGEYERAFERAEEARAALAAAEADLAEKTRALCAFARSA